MCFMICWFTFEMIVVDFYMYYYRVGNRREKTLAESEARPHSQRSDPKAE